MLVLTILTSALAGVTLAIPAKVGPRASCSTGLHLLVARGTGADQATGGSLAPIYQGVVSQISGSDVSEIVYPANSSFVDSCTIGVNNMRDQIASYASHCPKSKMVLLGYSQGALVIGDLLNGNGICGNSIPLDSKYVSNIASVVQIADPAQGASAFFNSGSGASSRGRVPRSNASGYDKYKGKIVEYCAADDYWCASGSDSNAGTIHENECSTFKNSAISYIVNHK